MNVRWIAALLLVFATGAVAQDMRSPRITFSPVDWDAVAATLATIEPLQAAQANVHAPAATPNTGGKADAATTKLEQLNAATAKLFPNIAASAVPVLLPLDVNAYLRDRPSGDITDAMRKRYLAGFGTPSFFLPGPSGYDAVFVTQFSDIPDLTDVKYRASIEVHISGFSLIYDLEEVKPIEGQPVPELESDFPGIRRYLHESLIRYAFVRFGVPYVMEILCFDGGRARYHKPTCRSADRIAIHFLQALHIAGGTPHPRKSPPPPTIKRPAETSPTFSYFSPGWLLRGTGFRDLGGNIDYTVYSQIRFPIAKAPTFVNSQTFQSRNRRRDRNSKTSPNYEYPWRDNFCERRSFEVGQCPAGAGHQGQDIRPPTCTPDPGQDHCKRQGFVVAVRDGLIMRAPKQEAAYVVVNNANERIRFRYLHMNPQKMDEDGLLSGRKVVEGEFIGEVSTFSGKDGGTSLHLHFDVQVPTKYGWVFVNPYMTLVAAYARLIGGRGTEIRRHPPTVAAGDEQPHDPKKRTAARCKSKRLSQRARRKLCGTDASARASAERTDDVRTLDSDISHKSTRKRRKRSHVR